MKEIQDYPVFEKKKEMLRKEEEQLLGLHLGDTTQKRERWRSKESDEEDSRRC